MKILRKNFIDWDADTKRKLAHAMLPGGYLKSYTQAFPDSPTIIALSHKQIMGWAFALRYKGGISLSLFVNLRYRKQGVATRLIIEALKDFPAISLAEWDPATKYLFRNMQAKHPGKIIVYNWWKCWRAYARFVQKSASA